MPTTDYTTSAVVKSTAGIGGAYADADIAVAISAASRAVDAACGGDAPNAGGLRRFYLDSDANQVRYYTPESARLLQINDLAVLTSVTIDRGGTGSFSETWTVDTDFVLEPLNAGGSVDFWPYERLRVRRLTSRILPFWIEKSVKVTGQFGWTSVPADIVEATEILTIKLLRRVREAPFGVVTVGIDQGAAMRIARTDPDVYTLLKRFNRARPIA